MKITKCKYTILQIVDIGTNLIFLLIEKKAIRSRSNKEFLIVEEKAVFDV